MSGRFALKWDEIQQSLWFIPALMTLFFVLLAVGTVAIDTMLPVNLPIIPFWIANGAAEGARGVLGAIATGIITITGIVFSVTVIALQLAASQYSPRVLRILTSDRISQIVLGVLIGTFVYALLVLRAIRSGTEARPEFVPSLSVSISILLTVVAIGFLIVFVDHIAQSIQTASVVDRATKPAIKNVDNLFPEPIGEAAEPVELEVPVPAGKPRAITSAEPGYLLRIDQNVLVEAAKRSRLTIRMDAAIGEFIKPGTTIASVWPPELPDDRILRDVRSAFILGKQRTPEQDLEYCIIELADIGVRALSPGISDLTAAKLCIDRLSEVLVALGNRAMPSVLRTDDEGRLLLVARRTSYGRAVSLAFDNVRHAGASVPSVAIHLLISLGGIVALVHPKRHEPLIRQAKSVLGAARRGIRDEFDLARVEQAGKWLDIQ